MDLQPITMDPHVARRAFLEYRTAVRLRHNAEDEQIMRGYRELARGRQVVNLTDTLKAAGVGPDGFPRLAICRADSVWCHVHMGDRGQATFAMDGVNSWRGRVAYARRIVLPAGTFPGRPVLTPLARVGRALVPTIPPALRPAHALEGYHVLFEAEWSPIPPKDPALLKHLGGDLWAVLATWDLTPLERAVLAGRLRG